MADDNEIPPPPSSEVGSVSVQQQQQQKDAVESDHWRAMFEQQHANMQALIAAIQSPKNVNRVELPEFNPDKKDMDARSWCTTADLCFGETPLQGAQLVLAISKALKGAASTWLSQVAYQGITWTEFKVLFSARFALPETL